MKNWILLLAFIPVCCACGDDLNRKAVYPVTGVIHVDGNPVEQLAIKCVNVNGFDAENTTISSTYTKPDGSFEISTYETGDGVPAGEYILTVRWGKLNGLTMSYDGDKFEGKYDAENSDIKFTVTEGEPTDLGTVELTTKQRE